IEDDLVQGQFVGEHDAGGCQVLEVDLFAAFFLHQLEDASHVLLVGDDFGGDDRFANGGDVGRLGPARRVVHFDSAAIGELNLVAHAGCSGDQVKLVLAFQPLLNDLHVQ